MDEKIKALLVQLTLEEKAALCTGATAWKTVVIERLGIPSITVSGGPHGVRRVPDATTLIGGSLPATCFPTASALAATWDTALIRTLGEALGDECIALDVDILLGPGNNMKRTPLCGRNFEYFSEDPFLSGEMATSFILGVQSKGVGTSLKHFAANNQEFERFTISADIDERPLREIYLAAFERAVTLAKPWTVMCCYNKINGVYGSQNRRTLTDILKEEWGFEGFVVSDWGAVHDQVAAIDAGLDLEMPGPQPHHVQQVVDAVRSGHLSLAALDAAVERLLRIIFRAVETPKGHTTIDIDGHHALARRIAGEAIVLLKNDGGLLPLKAPQSLAIIGKSAREPHFQGGGSSHINPTRVDVPFDEIKRFAGDARLLYADGYTMDTEFSTALLDEAVKVAQQAEIALLFIALPPAKESEGYDRPDMDLTEQQVALIKAVADIQPNTVVILNNGSAIAMQDWIERVPAVLEAWMMGQAGGGAIADVLFGKVNPSGKLAETFPLRLEDTPAYINYPGELGHVRYGEGLFIGYRYYDQRDLPVLFPFGYGLSYTTFEYSALRLSPDRLTDTTPLTVSLDVTNTGPVPGKEIVQVYVRDPESRLLCPPKELTGFAKVALAPGETKTVSITLEPRAFAHYHPGHACWVTESGAFEILVGASSADIRLKATIHLDSAQKLPSLLTVESTVSHWFADPIGANILGELFQQLMANMPVQQGGELGMSDMMAMIRDLPVATVLGWFGTGKLPTTPEDMVDDLLNRVYAAQE